MSGYAPDANKDLARRRLRVARRGLSAQERARAQAAISAALLALAPRPTLVAAYAPAGREVDVTPALAAWASRGVALAFPRVTGVELTWYEAPLSSLRPGYRGIREPPPSAPVVALEAAELVLVPGLGFTRRGARLGQGGGFYDRALARVGRAEGSVPTVGIAFAAQVVPWLPVAPHDQPVERVLTDRALALGGVWRPLPGHSGRAG